MSDPIEHFRLAIAATGIEAPDPILADGKLHRFSASGRRHDDSGWYVLHLDGVPGGCFGDWRSGLQSSWCAKRADAMTPAERMATQAHLRVASAISMP